MPELQFDRASDAGIAPEDDGPGGGRGIGDPDPDGPGGGSGIGDPDPDGPGGGSGIGDPDPDGPGGGSGIGDPDAPPGTGHDDTGIPDDSVPAGDAGGHTQGIPDDYVRPLAGHDQGVPSDYIRPGSRGSGPGHNITNPDDYVPPDAPPDSTADDKPPGVRDPDTPVPDDEKPEETFKTSGDDDSPDLSFGDGAAIAEAEAAPDFEFARGGAEDPDGSSSLKFESTGADADGSGLAEPALGDTPDSLTDLDATYEPSDAVLSTEPTPAEPDAEPALELAD